MASNNELTVVMATDNAYGIPFLVTLMSLVSTAARTTRYEVYVLVPPTFEEAYKSAANFILVSSGMSPATFINMGSAFQGTTMNLAHTTIQTYYRLRIPELLPCKRCLYLDVDIVVCDDLSDLMRMDMGDALIAGVAAAGYLKSPSQRAQLGRKLEIRDLDQYVNAGVILMNTELMRKEETTKKFERLMERNFPNQDQDIINCACYDRIILLEPRYNVMTAYHPCDHSYFDTIDGAFLRKCYTRELWDKACARPAIIHYADRIKPWSSLAVDFAAAWWHHAFTLPIAPSDLDRLFERICDYTRKYDSESERRLSSLSEQVEELESQAEELDKEVESLQGQVERLNGKLNESDKFVTELEGQLDSVLRSVSYHLGRALTAPFRWLKSLFGGEKDDE